MSFASYNDAAHPYQAWEHRFRVWLQREFPGIGEELGEAITTARVSEVGEVFEIARRLGFRDPPPSLVESRAVPPTLPEGVVT